jgi:hypothetical protein
MRWLALWLVAVAFVACSAASASPPATSSGGLPTLGVSNGTSLDVTLVVNGATVAVYPARGPAPSLGPGALPPLPWSVEARSPSGRVLTSMTVTTAGSTTVFSDGTVEHVGAGMGRVDLSCGRLTIWAGDVIPSGPAPASNPGVPGDCAP